MSGAAQHAGRPRPRAAVALMTLACLAAPPTARADSGLRAPPGTAPATAAERFFEPHPARCRGLAGAEPFAHIELFFGLSRPGGVVSEAEFKAFVDAHVTPRFPDGLTLLSGVGQFRDASGTLIVEGAKLLVLLVPRRDRDADTKVEQIRREYLRAFQQQSVLRADSVSCVSF